MISRTPDGHVEFAHFNPLAKSVEIAADFNGWNVDSHSMIRDREGWWRLRLALPDGDYRFKYRVDQHRWENDFAAYGVENDKQGGWNSVLWVSGVSPFASQAA